MTQDDRWITRYEEVKTFIETNKRNPSKHRIEEHDMLNWLSMPWGQVSGIRNHRSCKVLEDQKIRGRFFDPFLIKGLKYPVRNKSH